MAAKKIVLIGPESSGKTTLTVKLASQFNVPFVLEYSREYLSSGREVNSPEDLTFIAKKQSCLEKIALEKCQSSMIFCDTDLHNIVVWSEHIFGRVDPVLAQMEEEQDYSLYLLLYPDLPWVEDGIRNNENIRKQLYEIYKQRLIVKKRFFLEIRQSSLTGS